MAVRENEFSPRFWFAALSSMPLTKLGLALSEKCELLVVRQLVVDAQRVDLRPLGDRESCRSGCSVERTTPAAACPEVTKFFAPIVGCRKAGFCPVGGNRRARTDQRDVLLDPGVFAGSCGFCRKACCSGVPWTVSAPAGAPKNRLTSMFVRPKLFAPMSEKPVSCRRVISVEKK